VATLDVLSRGRVDLGVGIGWQREEYEAAGLDFGARGRLLDHTLAVCRTLWSDERASYSSPELEFDGIHAMPKPVQPGGLPVWVSGRCNPAVARRLATFGRGWIAWGDDAADPVGSIPRMRAEVEQAGGDATFDVLVPLSLPRRDDGGGPDFAAAADRLAEYTAAGVTDVLVHLRVPTGFDAAHDAYAEAVAALRGED
jgi:alkanesulfonate monooxygenase SsuD/methylene tetrahydromethanopterin reductase-like flavin-dependent oxidoreductase (luciferase family)